MLPYVVIIIHDRSIQDPTQGPQVEESSLDSFGSIIHYEQQHEQQHEQLRVEWSGIIRER